MQKLSKWRQTDSNAGAISSKSMKNARQNLISNLLEDFKEEEFNHLITNEIKLENFEVLKVIGRGSFAKIYLVKKHLEGTNNVEYYALKVLKKK